MSLSRDLRVCRSNIDAGMRRICAVAEFLNIHPHPDMRKIAKRLGQTLVALGEERDRLGMHAHGAELAELAGEGTP